MGARSDDNGLIGFLRRAVGRLATTDGALEAAELREDAEAAGCAPISSCKEREVVTLHGTLRTVTLRPRGSVTALEAELYDGSGTATLIWLGQRRIGGISPGRQVTVRGRIGMQGGSRVLYNPHYELSA